MNILLDFHDLHQHTSHISFHVSVTRGNETEYINTNNVVFILFLGSTDSFCMCYTVHA